MFMVFKKLIIFIVSLTIISCQQGYAASSCQNDKYAANFASNMRSEYVTHTSDGSIVLYANPSVGRIATYALLTIVSASLGGALIYSDVSFSTLKGLVTIACLLGAFYCGGVTLDAVHKKSNCVPYLILDKEGITHVTDGKRIKWAEIGSVDLENFSHQHYGQWGEWVERWKEAFLRNKFGNALLEIDSRDPYLPISLESVVTAVRHYVDVCEERVGK
jgi:hypothetical protein